MSRCARCRGLLPAWLEASDPANARCPNCGHANGQAKGQDKAPANSEPPKSPAKATNAYAPLEPAGAAPAKTPSLMKTQLMDSAGAPNPALAKTMMLGSAAPRPELPRAPQVDGQARTPEPKRKGTLPQGTEVSGVDRTTMLPSAPVQAAAAPPARTTLLPSTPRPPVASPVPAPMGATPLDAAPTDAEIYVEFETPPPAPPSRKSLPAWVVPEAVDDLGSGAIIEEVPIWKRVPMRFVAVGAGGLAVLIFGVALLRHGPAGPEVASHPSKPSDRPPAIEPAAPIPSAAPTGAKAPPPPRAPGKTNAHAKAPAAAKPGAPFAAAKPAAPVAAARPMVPGAAPRPLVPAPAAPERQAQVASPRHLAVVSPREHAAPAAAPSADDQRRAAEVYSRGTGQLFQGHVDEAIASFKEAQKLDPRNPAPLRGLGLAYAQAGNTAQAVVFLKRYLKAAPTASDRALVEKRLEQLGAH